MTGEKYCMLQMFDRDEFDELKLHHQNFPCQYFALGIQII